MTNGVDGCHKKKGENPKGIPPRGTRGEGTSMYTWGQPHARKNCGQKQKKLRREAYSYLWGREGYLGTGAIEIQQAGQDFTSK